MKYCTQCGKQNVDEAKFCAGCGAPLDGSGSTPKSEAPKEEPKQEAPHSEPTPTSPAPPKPDNYLVWAILTTVLCCLPAGIASIVYSTNVDSKYNRGDYAGAEQASKNARTWAIVSAIVGFIGGIIWFIISFAAGL